jgi:hypothetical protein
MVEPDPVYIEAAIFLSTSGHHSGEYIASCAQERCGYIGKRHLNSFSFRLVANLTA